MFSRLRHPLAGVAGVCSAVVLGWYTGGDKRTVFGSWTTNTSPSVPWDWNWDRREPSSLIKPSTKLFSTKTLDDNNNNNSNEENKANNSSSSTDSNQTDDAKAEAVRSKATRHIILVRHGQYNLKGSTDKERTLTPLGEEQARLTGERLQALKLPINRLVFSTMMRAMQTAEIMMKHMGEIESIETSDLIREGAPIPPEPPVGHWRPESHKFFNDGARIEAGFRQLFHRAPASQQEDSYEVIVCHANVIRYIVCRALQFPPEAWLRIGLHNGSMTVMSVRPDGRVNIRQLGECGYMPPDLLSIT